MPLAPIPYARSQAYDNRDYVRTMADLMLRRGELAQQAALQRGAGNAAMWNTIGNTTMGTMAAIGNQRDEERNLAAVQAERDRAHALQVRQIEERAAERHADIEWRNQQFREGRGKEFTEGKAIGAGISPEEQARMVGGTASAGRWAHQPAQEARLPAAPMADMMGYAGYSDEQGMTDYAPPVARTMSMNTAASPEQFVRTPDAQESLALQSAERQEQALAGQQYDRRIDNARQARQAEIQMLNIAADNQRADAAQRDTAEYRRDMAETRRFIAENARDNRSLSSMFTLSGQVKAHPAYTKMLDFESGLQAVETGLNQGNGPGDIAAINAFQRLVDPGVSVREGDVRLLESAIALGSKLNPTFWADKLQRGARLPEETRAQLLKAARELYVSRAKTYDESVGQMFKNQADRARVPYALIARDFPIPDFKTTQPGAAGGGGFFNDPARQPKR